MVLHKYYLNQPNLYFCCENWCFGLVGSCMWNAKEDALYLMIDS